MRIEHTGFDAPVSRLHECVAFYRDMLQMEVVQVTERGDRSLAFLAFPNSPHDHDIALIAAPDAVYDEKSGEQMQAHLALDLEGNQEQLREIFRRLKEHQQPARPVDHGISLSVYTADPVGNRIEVLCRQMTRDEGRTHLQTTGGTYQALDDSFQPLPTTAR